jgi:hypothetical protein
VPEGNLGCSVLVVLALAWDYSHEEFAAPMGCIQHRGLELVRWKVVVEAVRMMLVVLAMVDREKQLVLDQRLLVHKETRLVLDQWVLVERHSWGLRFHN